MRVFSKTSQKFMGKESKEHLLIVLKGYETSFTKKN